MSDIQERLEGLMGELAQLQAELAEQDEERQEALMELGRRVIQEQKAKHAASDPAKAEQVASSIGKMLNTLSEGALEIRKAGIQAVKDLSE